MELFDCFLAFLCGSAAEENVPGLVGDELADEFVADTNIACGMLGEKGEILWWRDGTYHQ